jgi:hypothetical protein
MRMCKNNKEIKKSANRAALGEHDELVVGLGFYFRPPGAKHLELVDELVDDVPQPLLRELELYGSLRV